MNHDFIHHAYPFTTPTKATQLISCALSLFVPKLCIGKGHRVINYNLHSTAVYMVRLEHATPCAQTALVIICSMHNMISLVPRPIPSFSMLHAEKQQTGLDEPRDEASIIIIYDGKY